MKVYARQIPLECQESTLFLGDEFWPEDITVAGNPDYKEHWNEDFRKVYDVLKCGELADILDDFERYGGSEWYKSRTAAIMDNLPPVGRERYSTKNIKELCNLIPEYGYGRRRGRDDDDVLCDVASIVLGEKYAHRQISGCCQGDWNYVYYPVDKWDRKALEYFETEYFNTGTEWTVDEGEKEPDDPEDICGWSIYCHEWNTEGMRKEIADAAGCAPEDVVMYAISRTRYVTVCEYAAV